MDNHYVPNLTIGPLVCEAIRPHVTIVPIDVHLMVEPVDALIPLFAKAVPTSSPFTPRPAAMWTARCS
jgi:ribulose-phosphate 3-epimerase